MKKACIICLAFLFIFGGALTAKIQITKEYDKAKLTLADQRNKPKKRTRQAVYAWLSDGTVRNITPTPGKGFYVMACIGPDGKEAVFHGGAKGYSRIWKYDFEKDTTAPLTQNDYVSVMPSYSWDGQHIVFSADRDFNQDRTDMSEIGITVEARSVYVGGKPEFLNLYVMNSDGSNIRQITQGKFVDKRPSFSPDGKTLVFRSDRDGTSKGGFRIWAVSADGSGEPKPLQTTGWGSRPWYSVDGKWIFFFTDVNGRHTICKMPSTGGEWKSLANDSIGSSSHGPFADLNGKHLWYHCRVDGNWGIFRISLDGGKPVQFIPPDFEDSDLVGHATRAKNGNMTFDSTKVISK